MRTPPPPPSPEDFYNRIHPEVEATFTDVQRREIQALLQAAVRPPSPKIVDIRFTFWLVRRLFFVVQVGLDRRRRPRRGPADAPSPVLSRTAGIIVFLLEALLVLLLLFLAVYLLKAAFGIDLFPGFHLRDLVSFAGPAARAPQSLLRGGP